VKVRVLEPAVEDLEAIHAYIARNSTRAADTFIEGIQAHVRKIARLGFVDIGKPGRAPGTRELVHGRYIVIYAVDRLEDELLVVSVIHGARRR
jgi:toxin ParE1/3/4